MLSHARRLLSLPLCLVRAFRSRAAQVYRAPGGMQNSKIRKKTLGNAKNENVDAPEASGSDLGSLQAPTWLGRGHRRPPGSILGGILDDVWMIFAGFSDAFLHQFFMRFRAAFLMDV